MPLPVEHFLTINEYIELSVNPIQIQIQLPAELTIQLMKLKKEILNFSIP